ncbi:ATP12 family chaperone protein [Candidatus Endowatersipora endosymbiont of Watersipora subatra]|uniref:ATP12 family chaperone protein n=1 Tax=Candidatus Endowatersipora endosymbiont of Watersipora subatra TaxID=3077946 RepID=UPI00312CC08E
MCIDSRKLPKRCYKLVKVKKLQDGKFSLLIDGRILKTTGGYHLLLPSRRIAHLIRIEWTEQRDSINLKTMPSTRLANTALDKVSNHMQAIKEDIIRYTESDLLCYRAFGPEALVSMQARLWDPILEWARSRLGARMQVIKGIVHQPQSLESIAIISDRVAMIECPFVLAAIHMLTNITGSCIIALCILDNALSLEEAWTAARVDEKWNISQWGEDEASENSAKTCFLDMEAAYRFVRSLPLL